MDKELRYQDIFEQIKKMALLNKNFVGIIQVCDTEIDRITMETEAFEKAMEKKYQQHEEKKMSLADIDEASMRPLSNAEAIKQLTTETNNFIMKRFKNDV